MVISANVCDDNIKLALENFEKNPGFNLNHLDVTDNMAMTAMYLYKVYGKYLKQKCLTRCCLLFNENSPSFELCERETKPLFDCLKDKSYNKQYKDRFISVLSHVGYANIDKMSCSRIFEKDGEFKSKLPPFIDPNIKQRIYEFYPKNNPEIQQSSPKSDSPVVRRKRAKLPKEERDTSNELYHISPRKSNVQKAELISEPVNDPGFYYSSDLILSSPHVQLFEGISPYAGTFQALPSQATIHHDADPQFTFPKSIEVPFMYASHRHAASAQPLTPQSLLSHVRPSQSIPTLASLQQESHLQATSLQPSTPQAILSHTRPSQALPTLTLLLQASNLKAPDLQASFQQGIHQHSSHKQVSNLKTSNSQAIIPQDLHQQSSHQKASLLQASVPQAPYLPTTPSHVPLSKAEKEAMWKELIENRQKNLEEFYSVQRALNEDY